MTGRPDRGNVSMFAIAMIAIVAVCGIGLGRVGAAMIVQSRAENAADAAALAAADTLALGGDADAARFAARKWARANGAELVECDCRGSDAEVEVEVPPIAGLSKPGRARARAEVDVNRALRDLARAP